MKAAASKAIAEAIIHANETPNFLRERYWKSPTTTPTINPPPTDFTTELAEPNNSLANNPPIGKARNVGIQRSRSSVSFICRDYPTKTESMTLSNKLARILFRF